MAFSCRVCLLCWACLSRAFVTVPGSVALACCVTCCFVTPLFFVSAVCFRCPIGLVEPVTAFSSCCRVSVVWLVVFCPLLFVMVPVLPVRRADWFCRAVLV